MPEDDVAQEIAERVVQIMTTPAEADPWLDEEEFRRGKQAASVASEYFGVRPTA